MSEYFRYLCSSTLRVDDLLIIEKNIPIIILCKLERIFPLEFFDFMEHLLVYLVYKARVYGSVQYRWMNLFEREMGGFKRIIKNRAKVEGSIYQAYISKETSNFSSYYFESHVQSRRTRGGRNNNGGECSIELTLSVFNQLGYSAEQCKDRWLIGSEWKSTHLHILLNCDEVESFRR